MPYVHLDPLIIEGLATEARRWTHCVLCVCVYVSAYECVMYTCNEDHINVLPCKFRDLS